MDPNQKDDGEPCSNNEPNSRSSIPDLCLDDDTSLDRPVSPPTAVADDLSRREEHPFSFKRFLNQDNRGARRKEFSSEGANVVHAADISSVLPDFVQDHLVVEQCYNLSSASNHGRLDVAGGPEERIDMASVSSAISLPDFLSDGPIHSKRVDNDVAGSQSSHEPNISNPHSASPRSWDNNHVHSSRHDNESQLRREAESLRHQVQERTRRIIELESEISVLRRRHPGSLESLQRAEQTLELTTRRLISAEDTVTNLRAENNTLKARLDAAEGLASEGANESSSRGRYQCDSDDSRNHKLAQHLRKTASSAEVQLLQLMSGIENIRILANAVEKKNYDFDDVNADTSDSNL